MSAINLINSGSYGVTGGYSSVDAVKAAADEKKTEGKVESASTSKTPDVDTYEKTQKRLSSTQLKQIQDQQMASFTRMLDGMLTSQAKKAKLASNGLSADLFSDLTVTPEQKLAAQQAISEDGEWGVNAVATRIVDMCVSLSGGDSSKLYNAKFITCINYALVIFRTACFCYIFNTASVCSFNIITEWDKCI